MKLRCCLTLLCAVAVIGFSPPAAAQSKSGPFTINASTSPCATIQTTANATVGIQVTGTFSATLQPEVSVQGQSPQDIQVTPSTSSTAQSTITGAGIYTAKVSGFDTFLLCVTSYASGTATIYLNATTAISIVIPPGNSGTVTDVSGTPNQIDVATGTTTPVVSLDPAVEIGSGLSSSLVPIATGQVASTNNWWPLAAGAIYPDVPTVTVNNTGGSLIREVVFIRLTYVGPAVIVPSAEWKAQLTTTSCASNSTCQIVVNMPTSCTAGNLPSGVTGCTVWDTAVASNQEKQQAASNACVNITSSTCTINTLAAGSTIPSPPASTGVVPSPLNAITQPDFIVPTTYIQLGDGSWSPAAGMDYSGLNVVSGDNPLGYVPPVIGDIPGTYSWTQRFRFKDFSTLLGSNAFVGVDHQAGQTTGMQTVAAGNGLVDDYAFNVEMTDANSTFTNNAENQSLAQYNERIVSNPAFTCFGSGTPNGETCAGAARFTLADDRVSPTGNTNGPMAAVAASTQLDETGTFSCPSNSIFSGPPCDVALQAGIELNDATSVAGNQFAAVWAQASNPGGNIGGYGYAYWAVQPTRFGLGNFGYFAGDFGTNPLDFGILTFTQTLGSNQSAFMGPVYEFQPEIGTTVPSPVGNPANISGVLTFAPSAGATTWQYQVTPRDLAGGWGISSTGTTLRTTAGAATLSSGAGDFNTINITCAGINISAAAGSHCTSAGFGVYSWDIYRTTAGGTPNTTGYIGSVVCAFYSNCSFSDTGLAVIANPNGDPTPPAYNTSGALAGYTYRSITNCAAIGSAASPSVAACGAAPAGTVSCATNATATCTVNTTAVTASSQIFISQREDTTTGTRLGVTCNVTPSVIVADENITAVVPGTSFSFSLTQPVTNPDCFNYFIVN